MRKKNNPIVAAGLATMLAAAPLASVAGVVATPALAQAQVVDVVKDDFKGLDSAEIAIDTSKIRLQDAEVQTTGVYHWVDNDNVIGLVCDWTSRPTTDTTIDINGTATIRFKNAAVRDGGERGDILITVNNVRYTNLNSLWEASQRFTGGAVTTDVITNRTPSTGYAPWLSSPNTADGKDTRYGAEIDVTITAVKSGTTTPMEGKYTWGARDFDQGVGTNNANRNHALAEGVNLISGFDTIHFSSDTTLKTSTVNGNTRISPTENDENQSWTSGFRTYVDAGGAQFVWTGTQAQTGMFVYLNAPVITASAGNGGSITNAGKTNAKFTDSYTYTARPAFGYTIDSLVVDGTPVDGNSYTFTNPTLDHTIVANFKPISYFIHFDKNAQDATGNMGDQHMQFDAADDLSSLAYVRQGYEFVGWNTKADGSGDKYVDSQEVTNLIYADGSEVTLYAQWKPAEDTAYRVRHIVGDTPFAQEDLTGTTGELTEAAPVEKAGYTPQAFEQKEIAPDGSTVVDIYYVANPYRILFDANDAEYPDAPVAEGEMKPQDMVYDKADNLNALGFTREGHEFIGWKDAVGNTYIDMQEVVNLVAENGGEITLFAEWKPVPVTVTYIDNLTGEQVVEPDVIPWGTGSEFPEVPAHEGYTPVGWDRDDVSRITEDTEVHINYRPNAYRILFDANDVSYPKQPKADGEMSPQDMLYDKADNLTRIGYTKKGYYISGWNDKADGSGNSYADMQEVINLTAEDGGEVTIYAQWKAANYRILFDKNAEDATGEMSPQDMSYDVAANLTANAFTREGWKFLGWKDNDGNLYTDMQEVINLIAENGGEVTLYAQWEREPVTPTQAIPTSTATPTSSTISTVSTMPNTGSENVIPVVGGGFAAIAAGLSRLFKKKREE